MNYVSKIVRVPWYIVYSVLNKISEIFFGISIGVSAQIGKRLNIEHFGNIIIHGNSVIGDDCMILQGVTLGNRSPKSPLDAPVLGNRVFVGAGAKILGNVHIGNDSIIGANAVVLIDVPENSMAVGVPAKILNRREFI